MSLGHTPAALLALFLAGTSLFARPVRADVQACVDAHREGQVQRDASQFLEAYDNFSSCMADTCPDVIRADCDEFRRKLDAAMPTVVPVAQDAQGNDVPDTVVEVDGRVLLKGLTGRAVAVNPGPRRFTFTGPNGEQAEVAVVVAEGVKAREILGKLVPAPTQPTPTAPATKPAPLTSDESSSSQTLAYALAGGGIVALGAFTYFGLVGRSRFQALKDSCAPHCSETAANGVASRYLWADISLAVAAGLFGGAAYVYFAPPAKSEQVAMGIAGRF
jgi:hypothetical protein